MSTAGRRIISVGLLVLAFFIPALIVHVTAAKPRTRRIHVELFRYGMQPEILHVNRGDTLIFTFSARDTAQSFFLQDYDIDVKVTPHVGQVEVVHPSDPEGDPEIMREVVITAGRPGLMGFFNTRCRFRNHVFSGPMHGFEQGWLVVRPNYLHAGATGLVVMIPIVGLLNGRWTRRRAAAIAAGGRSGGAVSLPQAKPAGSNPGVDLLRKWSWLKRLLKLPGLQLWLMTMLAAMMYAVILIALLGTTMAGGNLGILLVWVVWLTILIVVLVPMGGRVWCTICPLPMFGDIIQRGTVPQVYDDHAGGRRYNNIFRGLMLRWPRRLSNAVPRTIVFLCFATVSILIISQPRWTGWAIVLLAVGATFMPLVFETRAFCRWVCPINSFISLYSSMAKLALRANKPRVCEKCKAKGLETCLRGNEFGWACPYGLSVSGLDRNNECGLCMECVKSCSFENIALRWRRFGLEGLLRGRDQAWQAIVMMTLAVVYLITFQGPWHNIRDMVDIVDKENWDLFLVYSATLWMLCLAMMPLVVYLLARLGRHVGGVRRSASEMFVRTASSLVPLGLFIWMAFAIPMLLVEGSFVLSTLSDPFGWGWDLFGTAGQPWVQLWPEAIPWVQTILVLIGLSMGLKVLSGVWHEAAGQTGRALWGMLPAGALLVMLGFGLVWFFSG